MENEDAVLARLQQYNKSFDDLISLIPLKFYMPTDPDDLATVESSYYMPSYMPKEQLDPEAKTFIDVQMELAAKASIAPKNPSGLTNGSEAGASIPELREKLRMKIAAMRVNREKGKPEGLSDENDGEAEAIPPRSRQEILEKRLKRKKEKKEKKANKKKSTTNTDATPNGKGKVGENSPKPGTSEDISFGKISFGANEKAAKGASRKNGPDAKGLLMKAENKAKRLQALQDVNPEKAKTVIENQKWNKVLKMAEGQVVKDDLTLLKKTVKRKEKLKTKSSKDWENRTSSVAKSQAEKQKKRNDNLRNRVENKGKGKGKVAKSTKKPARPGFEGGSRKKSKK
ncbi:hypothetical protein HDU67_001907 [Dinochytrium kinnereticum]|nr:hypothetical protein HDU67_001907 [Dinochytrium kinnereticum]